jgi:hypothetical protein
MTGHFMTTSDLAERLKTPQSTVRYWRYTGYGPPGLKVGRRVLYRVTDVEGGSRASVQPQAPANDRGGYRPPVDYVSVLARCVWVWDASPVAGRGLSSAYLSIRGIDRPRPSAGTAAEMTCPRAYQGQMVDPATGEVFWRRCRSLRCPFCLPIQARQRAAGSGSHVWLDADEWDPEREALLAELDVPVHRVESGGVPGRWHL